jgi:hypothetical protein
VNKLEIKQAPNKNASGVLGPICGNCGGYGFTLSIANQGSQGCNHCGQTGVARMDNDQLSQRLGNLEAEIAGLKNIIMKELGKQK